jgi:hypothetical protein
MNCPIFWKVLRIFIKLLRDIVLGCLRLRDGKRAEEAAIAPIHPDFLRRSADLVLGGTGFPLEEVERPVR